MAVLMLGGARYTGSIQKVFHSSTESLTGGSAMVRKPPMAHSYPIEALQSD